MKNDTYLTKGVSYFINARRDLISLMPDNPGQKVLEIGMGGGDTLVHIKQQNLASEVVGIDLVELPGTNQQSPLIDEVYFIDLDKDELPLPPSYFDVIIAGDVLEHLIDPWNMLLKLNNVLKPGGHLLISLPNIRDFRALYSIFVKGSFAYTTEGIFDRTHMRFFCKKDMIQMIESIGEFKIISSSPIQSLVQNNPRRKLFGTLTFNMFEGFLTSQYLFKVVKTA